MKLNPVLQALKLWAIWNLVTDIGMALALFAGSFPVAMVAVLDTGFDQALLRLGPIAGLIGGLIVGSFQWLVLRNKINKAGRWISATTLSWIVWVTAFSIATWFLPEDAIFIWLGVAAFIGAVIGFAQFRVLKTEISNAGWWVLANIVGWITAVLVAEIITNTALAGSIEIWAGLIVIGMVPGVGFVFLFDQTNERLFNVKVSAGITLATIFVVSLFTSQGFSQSKFTLHGHASAVNAVAFSPDAKILVSSSEDDTIKLWDVVTGKEIRTLQGFHESGHYVTSISFSPDGIMLVSGASDGTVQLWGVASAKEIRVFSDSPEEDVYNDGVATFSPDGTILAWGSEDNEKIHLYDILNEKEVLVFNEGNASLLEFSFDGRLLASGGFGSPSRIWDVATGVEMYILQESSSAESIAFSPDGKLLAVGHGFINHTGVILWDVSNGQEVRRFGDQLSVNDIAFSPDSTLLAVGHDGSELLLFDISTGQKVGALHGHSADIVSVAFSPDGKLLVSGSRDGTVRIWDLSKIK